MNDSSSIRVYFIVVAASTPREYLKYGQNVASSLIPPKSEPKFMALFGFFFSIHHSALESQVATLLQYPCDFLPTLCGYNNNFFSRAVENSHGSENKDLCATQCSIISDSLACAQMQLNLWAIPLSITNAQSHDVDVQQIHTHTHPSTIDSKNLASLGDPSNHLAFSSFRNRL